MLTGASLPANCFHKSVSTRFVSEVKKPSRIDSKTHLSNYGSIKKHHILYYQQLRPNQSFS